MTTFSKWLFVLMPFTLLMQSCQPATDVTSSEREDLARLQAVIESRFTFETPVYFVYFDALKNCCSLEAEGTPMSSLNENLVIVHMDGEVPDVSGLMPGGSASLLNYSESGLEYGTFVKLRGALYRVDTVTGVAWRIPETLAIAQQSETP